MTKDDLRRTLIAARRAILPEQKRRWDNQIAQKIEAWCDAHHVASAAVFSPIRAEPQLHNAYKAMRNRGIQLALPNAAIDNQALTFSVWAEHDALVKDRFGVLVPANNAPIIVPNVLFVPCVGYTKAGYRLGYGGGFYDRTLAQRPKPMTVGIAYRLAECALEVDAHDVALDWILTND